MHPPQPGALQRLSSDGCCVAPPQPLARSFGKNRRDKPRSPFRSRTDRSPLAARPIQTPPHSTALRCLSRSFHCMLCCLATQAPMHPPASCTSPRAVVPSSGASRPRHPSARLPLCSFPSDHPPRSNPPPVLFYRIAPSSPPAPAPLPKASFCSTPPPPPPHPHPTHTHTHTPTHTSPSTSATAPQQNRLT